MKRNNLKRDYRGVIDDGIAGWHCSCCNPYGMSPRRMKPKARRAARHIMKARLANEVARVHFSGGDSESL